MPVELSLLPRLDCPPKAGLWRQAQRWADPENRRHAFNMLVSHSDLPLDERLARMRTLIDLGLWKDVEQLNAPSKREVRGVFTYLALHKALPSYESDQRREMGRGFLQAIAAGVPVEVLHLLLEAGADLEQREIASYSDTPLLRAIRFNLPEHAKLLLQAGADVAALDSCSVSPLRLAIGKFNTASCEKGKAMEIVDLLLECGAAPNDIATLKASTIIPPLWAAAATLNAKIVARVLAAGATAIPPAPTREGIINYAMSSSLTRNWSSSMAQGFREVATLLIEAGVELDQVCGMGMPPLLRATYDRNMLAMEVLLDLGADPCAPGMDGSTIAHHLVYGFEVDDPIVARVLAVIAPECWSWRDDQGRAPSKMLEEKRDEPGWEDYDDGPWRSMIHGQALGQGTHFSAQASRPRSRL